MSLTDEQTKIAAGEKIRYPDRVESNVDTPIENQVWANVSVNLYEKPIVFPPLGQDAVVFGFYKVRGVWPSDSIARSEAEKILKYQDSHHPIYPVPVGKWIPITNSKNAVKEKHEVDVGDRDKDEMYKAAKRAISREKAQDDRQKVREIQDRVQQLEDEEDIYADRESLKYYTLKRNTERELTDNIRHFRSKMKEIEDKRETVWRELRELEVGHPEYDGEWLDVYNEAREEVGLTRYIPPTDQFDEYAAVTLEGLVEKGVKSSAPAEFRAFMPSDIFPDKK
jgi:hypothetical protein